MKIKRVIGVLIIVTLLFTNVSSVFAKECKYRYDGDDIKVTTTKDANGLIDAKVDIPGDYDSRHPYIDGSIFTNENQCLETITVCTLDKGVAGSVHTATTTVGVGLAYWTFGISLIIPIIGGIIDEATGEKHIAVFGSSLDPSTVDSAIAGEFDDINDPGFWQAYFWTGDSNSCETVEYSGDDKKQMKESGNFISYCSKFLTMYSGIAAQYKEYGNCVFNDKLKPQEKSRCKANAFTKINNETDKLKNTCNNILQNTGISVKDGCARSCLGANELLKTLKEKYGLEVKKVNECSISSRLIIWIANIIRWVKYIIPVFVIIFGILDFMKATGSSKEDEMKKAQGRFIRRLVAAALIFIAPFIIQFIIEKMGFAANGCGIIDL